MVGPVGGPQFHQPFESDKDISVRNSKHALNTLQDGLNEVEDGVNNAAPGSIISGSRQVEHAMSVIKKNVESLNFDSMDTWDKVEPELNELKTLCNNGSMHEAKETIANLKPHIEAFRRALESNQHT